MNPSEFSKQYQQDWPAPEKTIDPTHPKPWFVWGYNGRALKDVLHLVYGAARSRDNVFEVPGGSMTRAFDHEGLRGTRDGTLFVLLNRYRQPSSEFYRMEDVAMMQNFKIVEL